MATPRRAISGARVAGAALGALGAGLAYATVRARTADPVPDLAAACEVATLGPRILVVAPHPDDETLAVGGIVAMARRAGAQVVVAVVTAGDGYRRAAARIANGPVTAETYRELGELRHAEADAALDDLGVPPEDRVFLGYPDAGIDALLSGHWDEGDPLSARNGCAASPYAFGLRTAAPYCGASLAADLRDLVGRVAPTAVVYPDPLDAHSDHAATSAFVEGALEDSRYAGDRFTYVAHRGHYPFPWAHLPEAFLRPPPALVGMGTRWYSVPLDEAARAAKRRALERHATQSRVWDMRVYMLACLRRNELLARREEAHSAPEPGATAG
jgi:N-acetyl-1-D-myo-inositol-2-amino-2-deoxy-alpha-D-glucopyranoside deacetylase